MVDTDRVTGAAKEFGGKVQGAVGDLTGGEGIRHQTRPHQPEVFSRREARSPPPTAAALAWTGDWRSIRARIASLAGE